MSHDPVVGGAAVGGPPPRAARAARLARLHALWHSPWLRLGRRIVWRAVQALPLLVGVLTITFVVTRKLGDPIATLAGPGASLEDVAALREQLGLDRPLWDQYRTYLGDLAHGDLGRSLVTSRPVLNEIGERVGGTLELIVLGTLAAAVWGIILGALSVYLRRVGKVFHGLAVIGLATPDFVLGLVLGLVFAFKLGWAPAPVGQIDLAANPPPTKTGGAALDALLAGQWDTFGSALGFLVLPVLTLGLIYGAPIAKLTEAAFQETRQRAFIEFAELAGLSRVRVFAYTLRNALPAVLTLSGIIAGYLVGGIVLVEIVFSWGGLGQWAAQSILAIDLPAIQAFVLLSAVYTLAIYLLLDIAYGIIDPRVRTA